MTLQVHGIPNCDTVKKARAWLTARGVAHEFHDFRKSGLAADTLAGWVAAVGVARLLNRKGTTWRGLDATAQAGADSESGAQALMLAHSSVIKRPVLRWPDGAITVGFDEADWTARLRG